MISQLNTPTPAWNYSGCRQLALKVCVCACNASAVCVSGGSCATSLQLKWGGDLIWEKKRGGKKQNENVLLLQTQAQIRCSLNVQKLQDGKHQPFTLLYVCHSDSFQHTACVPKCDYACVEERERVCIALLLRIHVSSILRLALNVPHNHFFVFLWLAALETTSGFL